MRNLTAIILDAYKDGIFPMAESADDEGFAFYKPHQRGLIPIENLHISHRLLKTVRRKPFAVSIDTAFEEVIAGCARATPKRSNTWINEPIHHLFTALHQEGHAHSIECRDADGNLAGGLYGLAIGAVFCGESMFSTQRDASKIALVHLVALLWKCGFTILDTQFINPHLLQFGAYEIPQEEYEARIKVEMGRDVKLLSLPLDQVVEEYLAFRGL